MSMIFVGFFFSSDIFLAEEFFCTGADKRPSPPLLSAIQRKSQADKTGVFVPLRVDASDYCAWRSFTGSFLTTKTQRRRGGGIRRHLAALETSRKSIRTPSWAALSCGTLSLP